MILKVFEIIEMIEADGWFFVRQKGSHMQFNHPTKRGTVTVPNHGRNYELGHKLVNSILKQAEI
ncbi:MAG: type II toxin-antitoxin system HicA family toxin [Candidatus Symbiothrix sp.]|jgi:predicted RNA binding protein YcfA (HicA-like mRNA interferase family)|nr:type II toxin-antitoxin system HicA family toxin [Candidatus Symbiothrix sp.]